MRRFLTRAWPGALLVAAALWLQWSRPLPAAADAAAFRQADHSLADALAKGDAKAVAALLDDRFVWVEADGKMHTKAQGLEDLSGGGKDNEAALDVRTVDFLGQVERQLGMHHNQRFAHLWVKNASGWQAFVYLNIPIPAERPDFFATPNPPNAADKDCDNPCKTLPYKPESPAQEG